MYSKVKSLRTRGARKADRDIQSDTGTVGHLTMVTVGATRELKLHAAGDDAQANAAIPILFDAIMVSMHGARMLFSGFERQGDQNDSKAVTFMQEWAVEVMAEQPSAMAQTPHRPG